MKKAHTGFSNREIDAVLDSMHPDIRWHKAFAGGYVVGHEAVSNYCTRHWREINPKVVPLEIIERPDGKVEVLVEQLVKDLKGHILFDGKVKYINSFTGALLHRMEIELC